MGFKTADQTLEALGIQKALRGWNIAPAHGLFLGQCYYHDGEINEISEGDTKEFFKIY